MASGDKMADLWPLGSKPTQTAYATFDKIDDGSTVVGELDVLDFAGATADEHAEWTFVVPPEYSSGGFDVEIEYAMDGTVGTAVQFEVRMDKLVATDAIGSHNLQAQTATDITDTPNGTANVVDVTPTGAVTHANAGSPAAGDTMRVRISRDYDHAANADDAQFIVARITET